VPLAPLLTFLVSGLAIVGAGSFLTARWIGGPLRTLSRTARALGAGDLKARAEMKRQDEIGEVGRAFDEMADRVEALLSTERELLANVSHELRTPLARIRVALDLASESGGDSHRPTLSEIGLDLAEIEALIDDILTAMRLQVEGGRATSGFPLHVETVAPAVVCERAAQRFRARHPDRELRLEIDERLPKIDVDAMLLRRAVDNLLENAHKYSPDSDQPVFLQARSRGHRVEIAVIDRGVGIAADDLPRVFAPFFRGDRSRSRGSGGVGLGLTLAKRIVEALGGTIDLTSAEGVGTSVRIHLEAAPIPASVEAHDAANG
jgi:signal transduction histidine kinase